MSHEQFIALANLVFGGGSITKLDNNRVELKKFVGSKPLLIWTSEERWCFSYHIDGLSCGMLMGFGDFDQCLEMISYAC